MTAHAVQSVQSLADGPAGRAFLAIEQRRDPYPWLARMVAEPLAGHPDETGLFDGAPAAAFTVAALPGHPAQPELDAHVERITRARLAAAHHRIDTGALPAKSEYDLIRGLTGLGVHLLRRTSTSTSTATVTGVLGDVLRYLVRLTAPRPDGLPGWWARSGPTGPGPGWEGGHGNLGLAHGIPGPLALLALALRRRIVVPGQADAIARICRWLDTWRLGDPPRCWWPGVISRADAARGSTRHDRAPLRPPRPSWCYGTPGITYALHLAGLALDDLRRRHDAARILGCCLTDAGQLARLGDASLCHGWAGVLHTARRVGQHDDQITATVPALLDGLRTQLTRHRPAADGLLTGDSGAALTRHAAETTAPPATGWDACLLLDDDRPPPPQPEGNR